MRIIFYKSLIIKFNIRSIWTTISTGQIQQYAMTIYEGIHNWPIKTGMTASE